MPIKIIRNRAKPRVVEVDGSLITLTSLPTPEEENALRLKHTKVGPKGGASIFDGDQFYLDLFAAHVKIDGVDDLDDGPGEFLPEDFKFLGSSTQLTLIKLLDDFADAVSGYKKGGDEVWRKALPEVAAEKKDLPAGGGPG